MRARSSAPPAGWLACVESGGGRHVRRPARRARRGPHCGRAWRARLEEPPPAGRNPGAGPPTAPPRAAPPALRRPRRPRAPGPRARQPGPPNHARPCRRKPRAAAHALCHTPRACTPPYVSFARPTPRPAAPTRRTLGAPLPWSPFSPGAPQTLSPSNPGARPTRSPPTYHSPHLRTPCSRARDWSSVFGQSACISLEPPTPLLASLARPASI
jgi:hypothetical protein